MSELLMSIGGKLPETVKTNRALARDAETEKLRQALLSGQITQQDMERQLQQQQLSKGDVELQKAQEDAQREREARSKLGQTLNSFESQKRQASIAQDLAGMEQAAGLTPLAEDEAFKGRSMRQVATETGLPQYTGQKDVEGFYEQVNKEEQTKAKTSEASYPGVFGIKKAEIDANPNAIPELIESIESFHNGKEMTDNEYNYMLKRVKTSPVSAAIIMDDFISDPMSARSTIAAQTPEKVKQIEAMTPATAEQAAAEQTAKSGAQRRLDKGELESLRTKRSIYDDLTSAKQKFDPKYATKYFGKIVKVSYLKQNVPGFSDFISDLERGVGKYRKDQFGASQTEGEANNLKDAINKDLDVDPKVFIRQINNFITSLERDYQDEVEVYKSDNVKVPEIFGNIKTTKTVNPDRDKQVKDEYGFTKGEKKFSKKLGRDAVYMGGGKWQ